MGIEDITDDINDLGNLARAATAARGMKTIEVGMMLKRKENKTEFERRAAKSFSRMLVWDIVSMAVMVVVVSILVVNMFAALSGDGNVFSSYIKRTGHVENGQVWYVQNVKKYIALSELGIDRETVREGDRITLYFDSRTDELVFGTPKEVAEGKMNIAGFMLIGFAIAFVVYMALGCIIGEKTVFKDFRTWYKLYQNGIA